MAQVGYVYHNRNGELVRVLRIDSNDKHIHALPITILYIESKKVRHLTHEQFRAEFTIDKGN